MRVAELGATGTKKENNGSGDETACMAQEIAADNEHTLTSTHTTA